MKVCSKCKTEKPLTEEFFHRSKTETKSGFKSACKECRNAEKREWRNKNKDRVNQQAKEYHINNREKRLEYAKEYHIKNREHRLEYTKEYYIKNREKRSDQIEQWKKENPEKVKIHQKRTYEKNKEKILKSLREYRKKNKEKLKIKWKKYRQANHEIILKRERERKKKPEVQTKIRAYKQSEAGRQSNKRYKHKRRMLEREAIATLTLKQWNACLSYFNNKCAYCGKLDENGLTQEHFVPVIKGGEYTVKNMIPACGSCNFSKCDRDFFDWYPQQKSYSEKRKQKILRYLDIEENTQQMALF